MQGSRLGHQPPDCRRVNIVALTPEIKAFHLRMKVSNPEHFPDVREPDWEFEQDYLDAVETLKTPAARSSYDGR